MFRFEYDRVVAYHPYRTHQPWDHGGQRLLHVDGVNGDGAQHRPFISALERRLGQDWLLSQGGSYADRDVERLLDNHYGFTVASDGPRASDPPTYYQLRFSDGSLYVWLMPNAPGLEDQPLTVPAHGHAALGLRLEEARREVLRLTQDRTCSVCNRAIVGMGGRPSCRCLP